MRKTPFCFLVVILGGRILALYSIRGSWWKPYLQASMRVSLSEKQQPAYTGILHWSELSFLAKTEKDSWQSRAALSLFSSVDHMPESQEASESFVGLSHISASTFLRPFTNYLSLIYLDRATFLINFAPKPADRLGLSFGKKSRVSSLNLGNWKLVMNHKQLQPQLVIFESFLGSGSKKKTICPWY